MKEGCRFGGITIFCIQILFLIAMVQFPHDEVMGNSFFREPPSYEEWGQMLADDESMLPSSAFGWFSLIQTVLAVMLVTCFILHYQKKPLIRSDFFIPIIGFMLYLPAFIYIKYYSETYLLWMWLLPLEVASLILLCMKIFRKKTLN